MHSNVITPPDIIDNELHTFLVINASLDDVDLITRACESSFECYNIYLYAAEMQDESWLKKVLSKAESIIINSDLPGFDDLYLDKRTYYYGNNIVLAPAKKIENLLEYFVHRNQTFNK